MTACLFVSPFATPAMMTDIKVNGSPVTETETPALSIGMKPANFRAFIHARKNYIISNDICISIAGRFELLYAFLRQLDAQKKQIATSENAVLMLRGIAEEVIQRYKHSDFYLTACYANIDKNFYTQSHTGMLAKTLSSEGFGECQAIGSGAYSLLASFKSSEKSVRRLFKFKDMLRKVRKARPDLERRQLVNLAKINLARTHVINLFSWMTAKSMVHEINLGHLNNVDFGGFYEYAYFDAISGSWRRQPSQVYLFYIVDDSNKNIDQWKIMFAFDPFQDNGIILSASENNRCTFHILQDIRSVDGFEMMNPIGQGWFPELATMVFVREEDGKKRFLAAATEHVSPGKGFDFLFSDEGLGTVGFKWAFVEDRFKYIRRNLGLNRA
jgi:hypothetical protein